MIKRFMVFAYDQYERGGGMDDYKESFDTLEEAKNYSDNSNEYDYYEIFDRVAGYIY